MCEDVMRLVIMKGGAGIAASSQFVVICWFPKHKILHTAYEAKCAGSVPSVCSHLHPWDRVMHPVV